jgi:hypothetical protein
MMVFLEEGESEGHEWPLVLFWKKRKYWFDEEKKRARTGRVYIHPPTR